MKQSVNCCWVFLLALAPVLTGTDDCSPVLPGCPEENIEACEAAGGVYNLDDCSCCLAGAHQVQDCEFGQGGQFNWQTCECDLRGCPQADIEACQAAGGLYNEEECACCMAGPHQVRECELQPGSAFNWLTCECDVFCTYNSDCSFGYECRGGLCVESECHLASPDGTLPQVDCPVGSGCEYADGIDYNHGNGYCVSLVR